MRSRVIHTATLDSIHEEGFDGWYNLVARPLGFIEVEGTSVTRVHSMQWDGAPSGKTDTILRHMERFPTALWRRWRWPGHPIPNEVILSCRQDF